MTEFDETDVAELKHRIGFLEFKNEASMQYIQELLGVPKEGATWEYIKRLHEQIEQLGAAWQACTCRHEQESK